MTVLCSERTDSARGGPAKASKSSSAAAKWRRGGVVDLRSGISSNRRVINEIPGGRTTTGARQARFCSLGKKKSKLAIFLMIRPLSRTARTPAATDLVSQFRLSGVGR